MGASASTPRDGSATVEFEPLQKASALQRLKQSLDIWSVLLVVALVVLIALDLMQRWGVRRGE